MREHSSQSTLTLDAEESQEHGVRAPFFALLAANAVSLAGNQLSLIAIPWFVLQTTGSAVKTGLVGAAAAIAAVCAGLVGGALVDRIGAKRCSVLTDCASGIAVALIPLLYATVGLQFWMLIGLVFIRALLNTPGGAARQSLLPDVIGLARLRLERGNAAYQGVQNFSQFAGPALAGLLIVGLGTNNVLWLDAASFVVSAVVILAAVPGRPDAARAARGQRPPSSLRDDFRQGFTFIVRSRLIAALAITATLANALTAALFSVILPVYARARFGSAIDLGAILAGWGAGAVVGSFAYGWFGWRLPRRAVLCVGALLTGLPLWIVLWQPTLGLVGLVAALTGMGLCTGLMNPLAFTLLQEHVPAPLRGRVFGAVFALGGTATPLAILGAGVLLDRGTATLGILAEALGFAILAGWLLIHPAFRHLPTPEPTADRPGA